MTADVTMLNEEQLRETIAALARTATPWAIESIEAGIDTLGAELLRRSPWRVTVELR
jgi:hypothetical protein